MFGFLASVVGVLLVAGLLFVGASLLLGRGETRPPADLDRSPVELPEDRPVTGDDVRALTLSVTVRGYRMTEVDWLLDRFAQALDERDLELAVLTARLRECEEGAELSSGGSAAPGGAPDGDGAAAGPHDPAAEDGERSDA